ncbi:laminin subunit alpha-3 [Enoplosus armatus]|uniref:laminin subunit alpha-3 n=1 Tax=Enoplosus armatus TaxID=215367 RepID=UPI00399133AE
MDSPMSVMSKQGTNCQFNTSGDRCERCKEGYYGNADNRTCRACPCPFTWSKFALACLDVGSGVVECLCKRGYSGARCERCAFGYYGNPMAHRGSCKPCNCKDGTLNTCDSLTGECDSCSVALLVALERMDDALARLLKQQLQNATDAVGSLSRLNHLEANISETKVQFMQDLAKQLTEVKPGESVRLSENNKARMMEEAQSIVQEMRERGCAAPRDKAGREQEEAHKLLDILRDNMTVAVETNQTADSLMASGSSLREVAELLSDAADRVSTTQGLHLESRNMLQHLEHLHTQLEKDQSTLLPVTEMTKDLLKNITDLFLMLEGIKKEFENHAAQLDGAKLELFKKLHNIFQMRTKVDIVTKAEEHAEELSRAVAEFQQVLHNATNNMGTGAHNSIISALEKAEKAANQSRVAADQALKELEEGSQVNRAEGLKDNSTRLHTEANETSALKMTTQQDRVNKLKEKGESLRTGISAVSDDIRKIKRDDTEALIESAETAASASNSTVSNITERLRTISQEVERLTDTNVSVNIDDLLFDADQAVKNLNTSLPVLKDKIAQVEALSEKALPTANMTESIWRIKDVIEETRNFVNRLSAATTFNGKGHVELRPPRNLEDIKAFTAVDLLLNRHQNNPSKVDYRRMRRRDKHRDGGFFVFYLGNRHASGDYIGMAIRSNVLICVYKLGGVVHEVETSQITTTTNVNSSDFDRVVFHRVYQDAEVNITQNFTSQKPVRLSPKRNLPNTTVGILDLDPNSVVFYVGGHPEDFAPPVELHYPKYRGAMKLSYINDNPVCLFNYKRAVNMDATQRPVRIPQSEVSDYYEGTGYRMAFIKEPDKMKRRLFKFHINSRETNALLFYIGNEKSFVCVFVERGFLVLQGQRAGGELRARSAEKVSLFDKHFAITIADTFILHYGPKQISIDHSQTNYMSYYIGGLPAPLRQRHNITAPPLRGCVDHLTADAEIVGYNRTIGVSDGCPVSLLGVRSATLCSALSAESLLVWREQPLRVSLGFSSTDRHGTLLRSSSQGSSSGHDLQLSLADGYAAPAGSQCRQRRAHRGEYQLSEGHSWLSYTLPQQDLNHRPHFSLDIKTKSSKGLILHVAGRGVVPLLALYVANGKIKMSLGRHRIIQHEQKSNDGNWHRVEFSVEKSSFHLLVDGIRVTDGHLPNNEGSSLVLHNPVYLGGDAESKTTKGHNVPMNSVIGCVRDFKMNEEVIEPEASHRTLPCFDSLTEMGTYFGGGHAVLDNYFTIGSQFVLAFELRPQHLTGLLFHVRSHKTSLNVFLMENKVGVKVNDGSGAVSVSVTPRESLCDGTFHVVTVSKQHEVITLVVDSMSEQKAVPFTSTSYSTTLDTLYIGGTTKQSRVPVSSPFVGCLRNVKLNGRPVAFETGSRVVGPVSINRCPAD